MIEDIILLFCFVDDFCKECAKRSNDYLIETGQKMRKPTRVSGLEMSEIITIILLFYRSNMMNFKAFYKYLDITPQKRFSENADLRTLLRNQTKSNSDAVMHFQMHLERRTIQRVYRFPSVASKPQ